MFVSVCNCVCVYMYHLIYLSPPIALFKYVSMRRNVENDRSLVVLSFYPCQAANVAFQTLRWLKRTH
jgi:hypothetical protein